MSAPVTTALFVPADRPDRFGKATASGADFVILDLEDAVTPSHKRRARDAVLEALSLNNTKAAVRINPLDLGGEADLNMLNQLAPDALDRLRAVLLPKAEAVEDVASIVRSLPGIPIIPIIETAVGLTAIHEIAQCPQVERLAFGALDFGTDLSATSSVLLDFARCQIVVSSRAAGLRAPLDSPNPEFRNHDAVRIGARAARDLGFGGQLCIHPLQVAVVADAFRPTNEEVAWAHRMLSIGGLDDVAQIDGAMVDRPLLLRARAILQRVSGGADALT